LNAGTMNGPESSEILSHIHLLKLFENDKNSQRTMFLGCSRI
jgi:hypothetical protein